MFSLSRSAAFRVFAVSCASVALFGTSSLAAQVTAGAGDLAVGMMAPDFSVEAVNMAGVMAKPFKLSEHRGRDGRPGVLPESTDHRVAPCKWNRIAISTPH